VLGAACVGRVSSFWYAQHSRVDSQKKHIYTTLGGIQNNYTTYTACCSAGPPPMPHPVLVLIPY